MVATSWQIVLIFLWITNFRLHAKFGDPPEEDTCENQFPEECGTPKVQPSLLSRMRIVGGNFAVPNSWPWQLSLQQNSFGNLWKHNCGASILSSCYAVTAAHCVADHEAFSLRLIAGLQDRSKDVGSIHKVARIIVHPLYKGFDTQWVSDIALLRVVTPFPFSRNVSTVCLPTSEPVNGDPAAATGWGYTQSAGHLNSTLNQVEVPVIAKCELHYRSIAFEGRFCAGYPKTGGKDTCQGDSGGPLVTRPTGTAFYLAGVTSVGAGCAEKLKPGIYTDVFLYRDWINGYIRNCRADFAQQCEQGCVSQKGSYTCTCRDGYMLSQNLKSCVPECGKANNKEQPWLLSLRNVYQLESNKCTGVVINSKWIITTTRCVSQLTVKRQPKILRIFSTLVNVEDVLITKIFCSSKDGLCMLETSEALSLTPVCLPASTLKQDNQCAIAGWMQDSIDVSAHRCAQNPKLLCSTVQNENALPNGDSPEDMLICAGELQRRTLYGLAKDQLADNPNVVQYADVYKNRKWIDQTMTNF